MWYCVHSRCTGRVNRTRGAVTCCCRAIEHPKTRAPRAHARNTYRQTTINCDARNGMRVINLYEATHTSISTRPMQYCFAIGTREVCEQEGGREGNKTTRRAKSVCVSNGILENNFTPRYVREFIYSVGVTSMIFNSYHAESGASSCHLKFIHFHDRHIPPRCF